MGKRKKGKRVATLDLETDPFLFGRTPWPFAAGFFDGDTYHQTWGDNCVLEMMDFIANHPDDLTIYVHNGGGFDFWYFLEWITGKLLFIHNRLCKAEFMGRHEIRDSYKMIPVPLADFNKESIDYKLFERNKRERHRKEIGYYLQKDCEYLYQLVVDFIKRFGMHLTIGAAAIHLLRETHEIGHESEKYDARFRPWYMGGRCEVFERGELKTRSGLKWKYVDVNSLYPDVMHSMRHPVGASFAHSRRLPDSKLSFARITAESNGALPIAFKGLKFPHGVNDFWACSHEIHAGIDLGYLRIIKVHEVYTFNKTQTFAEFVETCITQKIACEEAGDKAGRLFYKLLANNGYGKAGQNPRNFQDCELFETLDDCKTKGFVPAQNWGEQFLGVKPAELQRWSFNNVAIAASITSGARAKLMRGLAAATRPVYCDTDSIICEEFSGDTHASRLGAWKVEAEFDTLYAAGKKLYACYDNGAPLVNDKGKEKKASKGANLSADTIRRITLGETVRNEIDAPLLRLGKDPQFISRNIRSTY